MAPSKLRNWPSKFWKKFRSLVIHNQPSRHQRRQQLRYERQLQKAEKGNRIAQYNEQRRQAKRKAGNRRRRKTTRALHQWERRRQAIRRYS